MVTRVEYISEENEIVSLAKVKKQLRLEEDYIEEDELLEMYTDAAVGHCENFIGGHIVSKEMVIAMDAFASPTVFEAFPVQGVASVEYYAEGSDEAQTLDAAQYALTNQSDKHFVLRFKNGTPATAERTDAVTVTVKVGYPAGKVPKPIIQSILLQVADMYERREDRADAPSTVAMSLLRPFKKY